MKKILSPTISSAGNLILIISILFIVVGYLVMSFGDRTVSVILLIIAYIVLIPVALMIKSVKKKKDG